MPISSDIVGATSDPARETVDDRWAMNYAASVGDSNPLYFDNRASSLPVHPGYISHLEWEPIVSVQEKAAASSGMSSAERLRGVHSFNDTRFHLPVRSGDDLTAAATIIGVDQRRSGARVTYRIETTNQDGAPVATSITSTIFRDVTVSGRSVTPDIPAAEMIPADAPVARTERIELSAYAAHVFSECARDYNPIHTDRKVADAAGLPGLILHGTGTFAYALSSLINHECAGDPARISRIRGRLGAMLLCPSTMTVEVYADLGETGSFGFSVLNEDGERGIGDGCVEIRTDSEVQTR